MDTNLRFSMLNRDLPSAVNRTAKDPIIARETKYYEENIGNVKTVDDLLDDYRLYNFVMKAMGMEDMAYAKGMVRKVLMEGTEDEKALANTLSDDRFKDLAETFQFNKDGTIGGTVDWSDDNLDKKVVLHTNKPGQVIDDVDRLSDYFQRKMQRDVVFSVQLLTDPVLYRVVSLAFDVPSEILNGPEDERIKWFEENIDIEKLKRPNELKDAVDKFKDKFEEQKIAKNKFLIDQYVRVNFEEDEGEENDGVRLALNFQRTAGDITDAFEILASPALYQVVRTVLDIPESLVGTDIDAQAALINEKLDIEKFKDPEEVSKFIKKFVILYDAINNLGAIPTVQLFTGNPNAGISGDLLATFNSLKFGG